MAELFERGVGESTDVVSKEMYTFLDKGGRSITLRPEYTPSVARAIVEHRLDLLGTPMRRSDVAVLIRPGPDPPAPRGYLSVKPAALVAAGLGR